MNLDVYLLLQLIHRISAFTELGLTICLYSEYSATRRAPPTKTINNDSNLHVTASDIVHYKRINLSVCSIQIIILHTSIKCRVTALTMAQTIILFYI